MRIAQMDNNVIYYLEVDPEYINPTDGKGKNDAISFTMGQYNEDGHEIDSVLNCNIQDARIFALTILMVCDEVEGIRND